MPCDLLWNSTTFFLYRCSTNVSCIPIDQSLYICSVPLSSNITTGETSNTTLGPWAGDKTNNTTFVSTIAPQEHTSLPPGESTTKSSPYSTTPTSLPPKTSTVLPDTVSLHPDNPRTTTPSLRRTTHERYYSTTTRPPLYLTTSQSSFNKTRRPLSSAQTNAQSFPETGIVAIVLCLMFIFIVLFAMYRIQKKPKMRRNSHVIPVDKEEVSLEEQFRINALKMKRVHAFLRKKKLRRKQNKIRSVAKVKMIIAPRKYPRRRKRKDFRLLSNNVRPPRPPRPNRKPPRPPKDLEELRKRKLVSSSRFKVN